MVLYPDVQVKAHAQIDRVLDSGRLPSFSDYSSLPYIEAIVKESLRWNPVVPLSMFSNCIDSTETLTIRSFNRLSSSVPHRRHLRRILSTERYTRDNEHLVGMLSLL